MKVAVLGTACLDRVVVPRISANFDFKHTTQVTETDNFGGSMHNVAYHLGVLGVNVDFHTKVGNDHLARLLVKHLEENGVSVHAKIVDGKCATFTCLEDEEHGKIYLSTVDERYFYNATDTLSETDFQAVDWGITDNNNEVFFKQLMHISPKTKWIMNARPIDFSWMKYLQGYILNRDEAKRYGYESLDDFAKQCLSNGLQFLIVTLDKDGLIYYDTKTRQHFSPLTGGKGLSLGCGDAFSAGFLYAITEGCSPLDAVTYGLKASAIIYKKNTAISEDIKQIKNVV